MATTLVDTELVATISAFAHLGESARAAIAALARLEEVGPGELVFREGTPADDVRFVVEGRLSLSMRMSGREVIVLSLGPSDVVGWSALLGGSWTATARAVEACSLLRLPGVELAALCDRDHDIGYGLMKSLFSAMALRLHDTRLQLLDMFGREDR
jgi:CRP-like cAMP-binding protein